MQRTSVILLIDDPAYLPLVEGQAPVVPYSHDQHLLQFGHESLRKGYDVYVVTSAGTVTQIQSFYPFVKIGSVTTAPVDPAFVVVVSPESLSLRARYPRAKIVGILPGTIWLEDPAKLSTRWMYGFLTAARTQIDCYLTQNTRMVELANAMFRSIARVDLRNRMLICPLGIVAEQQRLLPPRTVIRTEMGLGVDDIAFINAGGPWSWTDYNTSLRAFCAVVRGGMTHIKFYVMGLKQSGNVEHDSYLAETRAILADHADLIGRNLIVCEDWREASEKVMRFTAGADIGINANRDSAEAWQSYRLRFLDYMKAGLPVINSIGDDLGSHAAADAVYPAQAGDVESYAAAIKLAATDHVLRQHKAAAMRRCATQFDSRQTYGAIIGPLAAMPPRDFKNPREVFHPPLLQSVAPEVSPWIPNPSRSEFFVHQKADVHWVGEAVAYGHAIEPLKSDDSLMSFGFTIHMRESITAQEPEVLQIGARPETAQAVVHAASVDDARFRLVLSVFDHARQMQTCVTPDLAVGSVLACGFVIDRVTGRVEFFVKQGDAGQMAFLLTMPLKPFTWNAADQIWIGCRRLPATIHDVWVKGLVT